MSIMYFKHFFEVYFTSHEPLKNCHYLSSDFKSQTALESLQLAALYASLSLKPHQSKVSSMSGKESMP